MTCHEFILNFCVGISPLSLRFSLATGSVTPLTLLIMDALPSSPPREVWEMDSSSCWTFSRMNTCLSGERQVRGGAFVLWPQSETGRQKPSWIQEWWHTSVDMMWCSSTSCRWDFIRSRHQSSDPQSRRAALHWPARVWSGTWVSNLCFLSGTESIQAFKHLYPTLGTHVFLLKSPKIFGGLVVWPHVIDSCMATFLVFWMLQIAVFKCNPSICIMSNMKTK